MLNPTPISNDESALQFLPCADGDELQRQIASWLSLDPAPFALVCGIASRIDAGRWCGIIMRNGQPLVALAQTPPWPVIVASPFMVDDGLAQAVASVLRAQPLAVTSINAPRPWTEAIARALGLVANKTQGVALHRLAGQPQLPHTVPGSARPFRLKELALLQTWLHDFACEATPEDPQPLVPMTTLMDMRSSVYAWTVAEEPVSMARVQRPFCGGWTIGPVYTPPSHRGHGYAGAVVYAQCQRLLAEGSRYVILYTDMANPTSNRLYARIGFQQILEQRMVSWEY